MDNEHLKLKNQLCFPLYAASRLITREYQPYLEKLGITYPQYLVFLILWETDEITVNEIANKLILNTNTVTPLLKRMESMGFITRTRSGKDERKVIINLTDVGIKLQNQAAEIPQKLLSGLLSDTLKLEDLVDTKAKLHLIIDYLIKNGAKE